jgi:hypothetical protein
LQPVGGRSLVCCYQVAAEPGELELERAGEVLELRPLRSRLPGVERSPDRLLELQIRVGTRAAPAAFARRNLVATALVTLPLLLATAGGSMAAGGGSSSPSAQYGSQPPGSPAAGQYGSQPPGSPAAGQYGPPSSPAAGQYGPPTEPRSQPQPQPQPQQQPQPQPQPLQQPAAQVQVQTVTVTVQAPQPQPQPQPQSQSQPAPKKVATCPKKNAVKSRMSPVGKKNAKHAKGKTKPVAAKKTRKSAQLEAICKKQSSKPTKSHTQKAGKHAHSTTKQKQQAKKHKTKQRR